MKTEEIIKLVLEELARGEAKYPNWPTDTIHQAAIVNEESGELIRAALNHWYHKESKEELRMEAIQTAAMAIRFLKNL